MKKLMLAVAVAGMWGQFCGADPSVSLYGTIGSYQRSETIKVGYDSAEDATKAVHALGFEIVENYEKGKFLILRYGKDTPVEQVKLSDLVALAVHPSIRSLSPNEKTVVVGPLPLNLFSKVSERSLDEELSPKQMKLYDKRKRAEATVRIEVVEFNALGLGIDGHRPLEISVFGEKVKIPVHVVTQKDCRTLVGKTESGGATAVLKLTGPNLMGTISLNGRDYTVEPLGRGLHDHSKIPVKK